MQDQNSLLNSDAYCPSFNCYSSDHKLAHIASNVCEEFDNLDFESPSSSDEFEFVSLYRTGDDSNVFNGAQIGPVFPVFNRDLPLDHDKDEVVPERSSCSSSEGDELEGIPEGTYCVWTPKGGVSETTPSRCKKCNSTGSSSSKRWRFLKDLLKRSNSDGNKSVVFLTPLSSSSKKMEEKIGKLDIKINKEKKISSSYDIDFNKEKKSSSSVYSNGGSNSKVAGKAKSGNKKLMAAHEAFYGRSRKEGDYKRRTSYLPYRQDLIGFFARVNAMPRTFPHAL